MISRTTWLTVAFAWTAVACGDDATSPAPPVNPPPPPLPPAGSPISISPNQAFVGSSDLTITIKGVSFGGAVHDRSQAVWSGAGGEILLATTFVSDSQLTAVVPAALLSQPGSARIFVETGDPMGDVALSRSAVVIFAVSSRSTGPSLSISPASAEQGGSDLVLTVHGSDFAGRRHFYSQVVWSWSGVETGLATSFVSDQELTAVVPARLLRAPGTAQVFVQTGDPMGDIALARTTSASFVVLAAPPGAHPFSISPSSARQGSGRLVLTISGEGFVGRIHYRSIAVWFRDGSNTYLPTRFVSESKLKAVIPAQLLRTAGTAQIFVETGDIMSDGPLPRTQMLEFKIKPAH